jgi:hypothetical protein
VFETTQRFVYDGEDLILAFSGSTNVLTNRYPNFPSWTTKSASWKIFRRADSRISRGL